MAGWLNKYQEGGEVFLQPNSKKLPKGYKVPLKDESSELAMSIGGEQGEPAYLIPSFKYGKPLLNPLEEYRETGEHLGGPFKTWQEADKWEREIRHPYVEKGQPIPSPLKYWGEGFKNGGIIAQGGETIPLSREIPEITVYGKKKYLQELDKQQQKYLADMAKYKQDSVQWVKANKAYQDSLVSYNRNRKAKRLFDLYTNYYDSDLKGIERVGNKVSIPSNYRQASDKDIIDAESGKMPVGGIGSEDPRQYVFSTNKENILLDRGITDILTTGYNIPIKPTSPIAPIKPTGTNVSYDDRYENLQMRPLWATMAKQDTTSKIGTLNSLDPLYEKGFTYGEAQKFPEEIKKQYKLDYPIYAEGGNVSYTPEYIEQLKQFENLPDNLAYHLDNKKIPTIGWGHKITEEELKRKAIKMGKEWVPYERFSGKEGRILADKLMEQDVAHHYTRLERQVGKDTLSTLPPEVQDVLLDITYNRGSLGDSLKYVKKGDIAGLRDYLAETSKELKGGAKTRMEWRANRIPLKTLPPVETPIYYTDKDKYVPKALQSIAEVQLSPQALIPIQDNEGYRNQENYGKPVQITSNRSRTPISMDQVPFPILAMSDTGELKIMMPGEEHTFEGGSVTELPIAQEGVRIKSDDRNWLQRTNDKIYSEYQEHKPQLFKDFPITDVVEPVISYLTGHSDPDTGLMNILPSANLPNKYYRRLTEGQISKAIREKGLVTPTVKEKGLTVTKSFPKKGQYILELSTDKPVSTNPLSISYGKTHPSQTYSFPDIVDLQSGDMKMFRRLNKKLIEVDPKLYGAPNKQALIDKQVVASMSPASGSLPTHHYAGEETLLSPHKIYKGGQNSPQLSLDKDYVWGIENVGINKSTLGYFDPSRKNEFSPYIVNDYNRSIYQPIYDNPNVVYYPSTQSSKNKLTPFSKNIQKYVESLSDEISPDFKSPQMINSVRNYYKNHFGEDVSMLSNEDISKFIQKSYNESGAKGILYHSTDRPMTEYNPSFPAEEKIRKGWLGEGVYFSDVPSQDYGLLQEPFIHSGIEKKVIINDIYNPKNPTVRFTSPQKEVDDILKKISKPITRFNKGELSYRGDEIAFGIGKHKDVWNRFIKDKNVDAIYSATSTKGIGKNWPEIIIPPSSSVNLRSLYPHPELIEESLKTGRLNRDWNNPMINYEDGGNIQKSNQLRTFTKDIGWLSKYKEQ